MSFVHKPFVSIDIASIFSDIIERRCRMKCMTIRQPWATLISLGIKLVENRTWFTKHRGPLLIHAGLGIDQAGFDLAAQLGIDLPNPLPRGVIVCQVNVVDCIPLHSVMKPNGPFCCGPVCWLLDSPVSVDHIPIKGQLGLFEVPFPI